MRKEREAIQYLQLSRTKMHPQVRTKVAKDALEEVMQSLERFGQINPIRVRMVGDDFIVSCGHLRFLAAQRLGWETIAAVIDDGSLTAAETTLRQLAENLVRVELSDVDAAKGLAEVIEETGCNKGKLAELTGLLPSRISKLLPLLKLDAATQEQVANGTIPADTAYHLSRIRDPAKQAEMAAAAANGEVTRDEVSAVASGTGARSHGVRASISRVKAFVGRYLEEMCGDELSMDSFATLLKALLAEVRKAKAKNLDLDGFVRSLRKSTLKETNHV